MVHRKIEDVEMPFFLWKKISKAQKVNPNVAFDTETIDGECFLIADSIGTHFNSNEFKGLDGLLRFLNSKKYRTTNNWFYNLEYDTNSLLRFLSFDDRKFIAAFNYIDYRNYRIQIIPRKELKISVLKDDKLLHTTAFYDLAQFYNFKSLKVLAAQTDYDKVYVEDIAQIDIDKYYSDKNYEDLINSRCVIDCKITVQLADKLTKNIQKIVKINKYRSKASIARKYVLENLKNNLKMPSTRLLDCALKSYHAGHIETCQIGMFDNIHNYDLKSAYPSFIATLYETSGKYLHNSEYEPDTAYSFYNINVDYENDYLSPLWYFKANKNYHVNGKFETWVTQSEIEYLFTQGYNIKILKAYHIKKNRYTDQPFFNIIHDLYNERLKAKDNKDEIELVYKVILNSIYGVTLNTIHKKILSDYETDLYELQGDKLIFYESQYKATNMYNPVYGTYITANTRSRLFTDFSKKLDKIVSVNTDGVYMKSKSDNVPISSKLGDYGYKNLKQIMFMGSGRYFLFNNGVVDNTESKFRSVPKKPSEICNLMLDNKNRNNINISREKPIKLKESIKNSEYYNLTFSSFPVQDYNLVDQFNIFNKVTKKITFRNDRRYWYDEINKIDDLWNSQLESRPFNINELQGDKHS
jgi:hypothetical protein